MTTSPSEPAGCEGCGLRPSDCLCAELTPVRVETRLVLLAHHTELGRRSNTGRLACRMVMGAELHAIGAPSRPPFPAAPPPSVRRLVLFPDPAAEILEPRHADGPRVLYVPDGTWSQARRIWQRTDELRGALRVGLPAGAPSRYRLRRNPRAGTWSTLEAVALALAILDGPDVGAALLDAFERFQARSLAHRRHVREIV